MRTGHLSIASLVASMALGCAKPSAETSGSAPMASSAPAVVALCSKDSDCVPAVCCHADKCVPRSQAPDCKGLMCTHLCTPNTIDCGGGCFCQAGQCAARLMSNQ